MKWLSNLFGRKAPVESNGKSNGNGEHLPEESKKNGSSVWCNVDEQKRRDAEIEAVKQKSTESHRDLTQTITDFNGFYKKKDTPRA
jgi:hypothetical protein